MPAARMPLYQEVLLLALREKEGTPISPWVEQAVAGAVLAELLLKKNLSVDGPRALVTVANATSTGDPVIDTCVKKISETARKAPLSTWVARIARMKNLRGDVATQLVEQGILKAREDQVLMIFSRKVFPEVNPQPEKKIRERLHKAIFSDQAPDQETALLVALAHGAQLLGPVFGRKEVRARKKRIEQIAKGELIGKATAEAVAAVQTAIMVATMMPAITAASIN
jgi:golgi phosphoprotein 3